MLAPRSGRAVQAPHLNEVLQHFFLRDQALPPTFVDMQGFKQPAAQLPLHLLDGTGSGAVQMNEAAGPAVVAAGFAELTYDLP